MHGEIGPLGPSCPGGVVAKSPKHDTRRPRRFLRRVGGARIQPLETKTMDRIEKRVHHVGRKRSSSVGAGPSLSQLRSCGRGSPTRIGPIGRDGYENSERHFSALLLRLRSLAVPRLRVLSRPSQCELRKPGKPPQHLKPFTRTAFMEAGQKRAGGPLPTGDARTGNKMETR